MATKSLLVEDMLHEMCGGSLQTVRALKARLKSDPIIDMNKENQESTPLFQDIAKTLIENGANVNDECKHYGHMSLHFEYADRLNEFYYTYSERAQKMRADVTLNKMKCVRLLMKRGAVSCRFLGSHNHVLCWAW